MKDNHVNICWLPAKQTEAPRKHRVINAEFASVILNVKFVTAASKPGTTGYVSSENLLKPSKRNLRANSS